jgi:hypothetical protein
MNLIERYIYAVIRRLQPKQRPDIEQELRALISDMLTESNNEKDIEEVLQKLGDPARLADNYRGKKRFLIGPDNYDKYTTILRIVLGAVFIGISVAVAVGYVANPPEHLFTAITRYLGSLFVASLQVFAWVTVGFAFFEYYGPSDGTDADEDETEWKVADLPPLPIKETLIKPHEPIIGIVFTVLALIVFNLSSELIGVYSFDQGSLVRIVPLFAPQSLRTYLPYINILFALGLLKETAKLYMGRWTIGLAAFNTLQNIVTIGLVVVVFSPSSGVWNPQFSQLITSNLPEGAAGLVKMLNRAFIGVVALALLIDTITCWVKVLKHRMASYI